MQGERQLHHAQVGPEMAAVDGQLGDQLVADFLRQLLQLIQREFLDVRRIIHHVQVAIQL